MKRNWLWMIPLLLLTGALGARSLNADLLFVDEYWSIFNAGGDPYGPLDPVGIWERVVRRDPGGMGIGYYWLLAGWQALVGASAYSVRAFSLLVGLLAVAMTYRLGAALFSRRVGLYAAAIMATSAFFIDYLHEARAYTLFTLAATLAVWVYWRIMATDEDPHPLWYGTLAGSVALLAYTHFVALALPAALGLVHLARFHNRRRWWFTLGAFFVGGLVALPWLGVALTVIDRGAGDTNRQATSMGTLTILSELAHSFSNGSIGLLLLFGGFALRGFSRNLRLVLVWLLVGLGLALLVNALIPFMVHLRYLIFLWPALALLVALGIWQMARLGVPPLVLLSVWLVLGIGQSLNPAFINDLFGAVYRAPWPGLNDGIDQIAAQADEADAVLFHIIPPGDEPFNYFVLGHLLNTEALNSHVDQIERMNNSFAGGDVDYLNDVTASLDGAPHVWTLVLPELETTQRTGVVNYTLQTQYAQCQQQQLRDAYQMRMYARLPVGPPQHIFQANATERGNLGVDVIEQDDERLRLFWRPGPDVGRGVYSFALHVDDAAGNLVAQVDQAVPDGRPFGCGDVVIPTAGLPAGDYDLYLVVYAWQTGERLPISTDPSQDRLPLGAVTVASPMD